jgi:carboxymethylenebutenolidase
VADISVATSKGDTPVYLATPDGDGPWPGVVVIHDALGMTRDLRNQADWRAGEGYLAAAPDLLFRGMKLRCLIGVMRGSGQAFDDVEAVRAYLAAQPGFSGRIGVIGFCLGGGFAMMLAPGYGFDASSVNYGDISKETERAINAACPIVASFGAKDRTLKEAPARLEQILTAAGVPHDIKTYPEAGHGFMNDHAPSEVPVVVRLLTKLIGGDDYHDAPTQDARRRIVSYFDQHLKRKTEQEAG